MELSRFRVLHAVDSLNVKHELRSKKIKQLCTMQTFPNDCTEACSKSNKGVKKCINRQNVWFASIFLVYVQLATIQ